MNCKYKAVTREDDKWLKAIFLSAFFLVLLVVSGCAFVESVKFVVVIVAVLLAFRDCSLQWLLVSGWVA